MAMATAGQNHEMAVRYGIIGVGMMGREHMNNLAALEGAQVVAVADTHPPSLNAALQLASSLPNALTPPPPLQVFADHKALLESGLCDVLVVSTPNMTHAEILLDILSYPKSHHVLVEKPLCTTVEDCKKVIEASKKRPEILLQVGLEYRYMPPIAKLVQQVRAGVLGSVKMVAIREHRFPFLVKVHNWNRFNVNSGGTLVEKCCHFFDLMNLIVNAKPVQVMASGGQDVNHLNEIYDGKVPDILDNAYVVVEYENGTRAMLDLCMFAEGSQNEQEICVVGDKGKGEALIPENIVRIGSRSGGRSGVQTFKALDDRIRYDGLHHGSSYLEHLEMLTAVKSHGDQPPAIGLIEGLYSVVVGVAAQTSIALGRVIAINEILG
ncbi:hypothetical protein O6H91_01G093000 [Diphasiastrum complanatum]|uniref:Uncharacterized protein n=2 Tax=Diphasiastrum complanatum TaxID=34168 RepID=A0ACC2ETD8_DIPCM|nr:hypothetical protein O6H91_01G092300 [Diphasiastrum complanatum]KAJ7569772.1 hypothetical protein O6H91_01G093000 [Diphasiastrum complanatum]